MISIEDKAIELTKIVQPADKEEVLQTYWWFVNKLLEGNDE